MYHGPNNNRRIGTCIFVIHGFLVVPGPVLVAGKRRVRQTLVVRCTRWGDQ